MKNIGVLFIMFYLILNVTQVDCNTSATQFTNYLWKLDLIGVPTEVNYLNDFEIISATNKGVVAKINVKNGQTIWKKLYKSNVKITTDEHCKNNFNEINPFYRHACN